MNVLGLVVFSIVFGIVLGRMGDKGLPLKAFFETLNEVVMKMVTLVMWYVTKRLIVQQMHALPIYGQNVIVIRHPFLTDILRYTVGNRCQDSFEVLQSAA